MTSELNKVYAATWERKKKDFDEDVLLEKINSYLSEQDNLFVLAYFFDSVEVGYYKDRKIFFYADKEIDPKKLEEVRIFNNEVELKVIASKDKDGKRVFVGRLMKDKSIASEENRYEGNKFIYDEFFLVYGSSREGTEYKEEDKDSSWRIRKEDRGGRLWVPCEGIKWLKVRNYLKYDKSLKFVDNRLMGFYDGKKNYLGGCFECHHKEINGYGKKIKTSSL